MKCKPNFTSLAESGKPASAGETAKRCFKKGSEKIQSVLYSAEEHHFTSSIHHQDPEEPSKTYLCREDSAGPSNTYLPPEDSASPSNTYLPLEDSAGPSSEYLPPKDSSGPSSTYLPHAGSAGPSKHRDFNRYVASPPLSPPVQSMVIQAPLYNYGYQRMDQSFNYSSLSPPLIVHMFRHLVFLFIRLKCNSKDHLLKPPSGYT